MRKLQREFRNKERIITLTFVLMVFALLAAPFYFFLEQNYSLFTELSHKTAPNLVQEIQIERDYLLKYLLFSLIAISLFSYFSVRKFLSPFLKTCLQLKKGLDSWPENISRTQHSSCNKKPSELMPLIDSYQYLKVKMDDTRIEELHQLSQILLLIENHEAQTICQDLIQRKMRNFSDLEMNSQFSKNETNTSTSSKFSPSRDSLHAS